MDTLLRRRQMMAGGGSVTPTPPTFYNYLYFDGTAQIQTDLFMPSDGSIRVSLGNETKKATQGIFAQRNENNAFSFACWLNSNTTSTRRRFGIRCYNTTSTTTQLLDFTTKTYNFFLGPKKWGWGTTSYSTTKGDEVSVTGLNFGSSNDGQPYTGRMGTIYIYGSDAQNVSSYDGFDNYTPVYTLKPCTYRGAVGLWCVETSTFYGNTAGDGALTVSDE